ncbi:MAG: Gfo/Idh/MocA family oxidoreductase [Eubacteriales bacterium]|nr:Gfo/Idh/MocA family oxidoreductase [Eubacteriales bacterium]
MKIGFVDDYLDNWHTNHYPFYIRLASGLYGISAETAYAYAWRDHPGEGISGDEWCKAQGIQRCNAYEELIEKSDAIMVMCADNCLVHEELAKKALMSGKPVYCDKTFAPTYEAAVRMFDLAEAYRTPVFSCSAQRFCMELLCFQSQIQENVKYCSSQGPGDMVNYSVHQFEMLETLMGVGAKRCMAQDINGLKQIVYEYEDDRTCFFHQGDKLPFRLFHGPTGWACRKLP